MAKRTTSGVFEDPEVRGFPRTCSVGFGQLIDLWTETRVPFPDGLLTTLAQSREHIGILYSLPPKELPANKLFWVAAPLPSSSLRCEAHISSGPSLPLDTSIN